MTQSMDVAKQKHSNKTPTKKRLKNDTAEHLALHLKGYETLEDPGASYCLDKKQTSSEKLSDFE